MFLCLSPQACVSLWTCCWTLCPCWVTSSSSASSSSSSSASSECSCGRGCLGTAAIRRRTSHCESPPALCVCVCVCVLTRKHERSVTCWSVSLKFYLPVWVWVMSTRYCFCMCFHHTACVYWLCNCVTHCGHMCLCMFVSDCACVSTWVCHLSSCYLPSLTVTLED